MSGTNQVQVSHTPGPWQLTEWDNGRISIDVERDDEPFALAEVAQGEPTDVALANGWLIAAAPELLEALEALFDRGHAPREGRWPKRIPGGFGGIPAFAESSLECVAAHEAIKKARGGQS